MDEVAQLSNAERNTLFQEVANKRGSNLQIIEKDFWVCWTLKELFEIEPINGHLIFKGGTSLSKVYNLIERFSEDIDIAIDRNYLGFADDYDLRSLSASKRDKVINDLDLACKEVVQNYIFDSLITSFSEILGNQSVIQWELYIDKGDPDGQTILFRYPREKSSSVEPEYLKRTVRIELGARPENHPTESYMIQPYAAEDFPQMFKNPACEITVLSVERTFWEKATILHDQYHRPSSYPTAERLSRHYYDFYKLAKSHVYEEAINNIGLLESVVINKNSFFYRAGAKYEEVLAGHLHLVPREERLVALEKDYEKMKPYFFAAYPRFDEIIGSLLKFEKDINSKLG